MSTASNCSLEQSCSAFTSVTSALQVISNVMCYINLRFAYLLTYWRVWAGVYGHCAGQRSHQQSWAVDEAMRTTACHQRVTQTMLMLMKTQCPSCRRRCCPDCAGFTREVASHPPPWVLSYSRLHGLSIQRNARNVRKALKATNVSSASATQ